ncbi:prepilin peptidase [Lachnospiraceae bacterium 54-53]
MMENINRIVFGMFLLTGAWQDGREKSISVWLLVSAGFAGAALSLLRGTFGADRILSCLPGCGLLLLSRFTDEAIGSGDGWFFLVSGLFLNALMNFKLLVYGTFLNGLICCGIYLFSRMRGNDVKKKSIPFLPSLVPVWIGLVML